jgi:hypothetical protein
MRCGSAHNKARIFVRSGKQHDIWHMLRDHTCSVQASVYFRLHECTIYIATISPIVQMDARPACRSRTYRLLVSHRLEEPSACCRETIMSTAEYMSRLRFGTSGQYSVGILQQ